MGLVVLSAYSSIYSKVGEYEMENKMHVYVKYQMKNYGGSISFNLILLPSLVAKNWLQVKIWNKNDCWCSKTRSKHIKGSKECLFIMTQTHSLQIFSLFADCVSVS